MGSGITSTDEEQLIDMESVLVSWLVLFPGETFGSPL